MMPIAVVLLISGYDVIATHANNTIIPEQVTAQASEWLV
jgi:hypothetical protein